MKKKSVAKKTTALKNPLRVGNQVFIRTVTMNHVGRVVGLSKDAVLLDDASWVADTGRQLSAFLEIGPADNTEIERMLGTVMVNRGGLIDVCDWKHTLPAKTQ